MTNQQKIEMEKVIAIKLRVLDISRDFKKVRDELNGMKRALEILGFRLTIFFDMYGNTPSTFEIVKI